MSNKSRILWGVVAGVLFFAQLAALQAGETTREIYRPIEMPIFEESLHGDVIYCGIATWIVANDDPENRRLMGEEMWLKSEGETSALRPFASFQPETPNTFADITTLYVPLGSHYMLARQYAIDIMMEDDPQLIILNDAGRVKEVRTLERYAMPDEELTPLRSFEYDDEGRCVNFKTWHNGHVFAESNMEYENGKLVRVKSDGYYGQSKEEFVYDDEGRQIAKKVYDNPKAAVPTRTENYTVQRDAKGNVVRRESPYHEGFSLVEEFEIAYVGAPLPDKAARLQALLNSQHETNAIAGPKTPAPVVAADVLRTKTVDPQEGESPMPERADAETEDADMSHVLYGPVKRIVQTGEGMFPTTKIWERSPLDGKLYPVSETHGDWGYAWIRDAENRIIEKHSTGENGKITSRKQFRYDESGKLVEILSGKEEPLAIDHQFHYDEAGRLIEDISFLDAKPRRTLQYTYDDEGRLAGETTREHASSSEMVIREYAWSPDGTMTETVKTFGPDNRLMSKSTTTRSPDGRRSEHETENAEGRLISRSVDEIVNGLMTYTVKKPVDRDLFLVNVLQATLNPETYVMTRKLNDYVLTQSDVRYDFDLHGNWTEQRIYENGRISEHTVREIEYDE